MTYTLSRRDALLRIAAILALPAAHGQSRPEEMNFDEKLLPIVNHVGEKAVEVLGEDNVRVSQIIEDIQRASSREALTEKIEAAVIKDFGSDDMVTIDGWFFSLTEAALYAAMFSLNNSSL